MTLRVIRTPMSSSDEAGILPASQKRIEERRVPCARPQAAAQARAPAALSPGLRRRARADRRLRAWVVRGPRPAVHALGVHRRRDEPSHAPALLHLRFVPTESTFDYFEATRAYLQRHGKPVAFYSDKHSVFRVNRKDAAGGDGMTQFGRALDQLNIDIICANAPQAKGRVERANST